MPSFPPFQRPSGGWRWVAQAGRRPLFIGQDACVVAPEDDNPVVGRRFTTTCRVRLADADQDQRARLDAIVRYLQDVATEDSRDAGFDPVAPWVVRRTTIQLAVPPRLDELLTITTACGGIGSRWAERLTTITGENGARVEAAGLWVFVDARTGRPARLTPEFLATYQEAAGGRQASARLEH